MMVFNICRWYFGFILFGLSYSPPGYGAQFELANNEGSGTGFPNIIVVFTDDQGYADLGVQGKVGDIRTPHIDNLALNGVRFTDGYVTAPVCGPSRIGMITGQYQQRFGVESNAYVRLPENIKTLPQRMKTLGYATGMVGKSHFGRSISDMGFDEYFENPDIWTPVYNTTHDLDGRPNSQRIDLNKHGNYRIDAESKAAVQFIKRHADHPFFLYVAYTAPHVPLSAPQKYLDRFPGVKNGKRKLCLAMMSAVDDGVGEIITSLRESGVEENTLVFFISDNGAPLDRSMEIARNGSLNIPLAGEKDLLLEGGIRVPWIMYWKNMIPAGRIIESPVITLDVAVTALALAGLKNIPELDGINLFPGVMRGDNMWPDRKLFWYTRGQQAVREGNWKLFRTTHKKLNLLVDLGSDVSEQTNLAQQYPEIVARLGNELDAWQIRMDRSPASELHPNLENRISKLYPEFSKSER